MNENNDKSQTLEFKAVKEEKVRVDRNSEDVYSSRRRNDSYREETKKSDKKLVAVAIILSVLLVIAIIVGAIIISSGNRNVEKEPSVTIPEEIIPEEEPEEEKDIILVYNIVFYGESVMEKNGQYTIFADLLNDSFEKEDNRKLIISDETDIRQNGKRLSKDALVYIIESMVGEQVIFEGEIRDKDNLLLSVSFDGNFREEIKGEETVPEENTEENPETENIPSGEEDPPETVENSNSEAVEIN